MINNLNQEIVAEEAQVIDFSEPIPAGTYVVEIMEIEDWETKLYKSIKLKATDEVVEDVNVFQANVKMQITEGEHKGRWIFDRLTTHPNVPWKIPGFVHALGLPSIKLSDIQKVVGLSCMAVVKIDKYKAVDKDTGLEEEKVRNNVSGYKLLPVEELDIPELTEADLGF